MPLAALTQAFRRPRQCLNFGRHSLNAGLKALTTQIHPLWNRPNCLREAGFKPFQPKKRRKKRSPAQERLSFVKDLFCTGAALAYLQVDTRPHDTSVQFHLPLSVKWVTSLSDIAGVTFVSPGQPCQSRGAECDGQVWERSRGEKEQDFQNRVLKSLQRDEDSPTVVILHPETKIERFNLTLSE